MKSSYKRLGDFIVPVDEFNDGLKITELQGISNQKYFQRSHTNTIGVDLSTYRIVRRGQFAFNRATTRNGEKISIALRVDDDCIVSPSYRIFKSADENILLSEYLMMWFRRPEFDRYARFKSHGSAHEFFDMDEMNEVRLPIPSPKIQREIVTEYQVVQNRMALNKQLIQKLEETAQALYKQWFVDFEFPNAQGQPYKSSGGEMVESELGEIPKGWEVNTLEKLFVFRNGKLKPKSSGSIPVYGGNGVTDYVNESNASNVIVVGRVGENCGSLHISLGRCWIGDNAIAAQSAIESPFFGFYLLQQIKLNDLSEGTGQPLITQGLLNSIKVIAPLKELIIQYDKIAEAFIMNKVQLEQGIECFQNLSNTLLSKLATVEEP